MFRTLGTSAEALVVFLLVGTAPSAAQALAPGDLDPTFGDGGLVTTDFIASGSEGAEAVVALQSDGKLVAAGATTGPGSGTHVALVRYNSDGSMDTSFGNGGVVTTDLGRSSSLNSHAFGIAVQTDGRIVVAGQTYNDGTGYDIAMARYNSDGSLDMDFGGDGIVTTDVGSNEAAYSVAVQADGKIVLAGYAYQPATSNDFALVRYNSDGTVDRTFGQDRDADGAPDGVVLTDFDSGYDRAYCVSVGADGRIVAAGSGSQGGHAIAVACYTADGILDSTFDGDGKVITHSGYSDAAYGTAIDSTGRIVIAGQYPGVVGGGFTVARYNADGSLDTTFGGDGMVATDIGDSGEFARAVTIDDSGRLVVAGYAYEAGTGYDFAVARYHPDGSLDTTFGETSSDGLSKTGMITADFGASNDRCYGIAVDSAGNLVTAGYSEQGGRTSRDFAVARFTSEGVLDTSFDGDGTAVADLPTSSWNEGRDVVAIQLDGSIVVSGTTSQHVSGYDFAVVRYTPDGILDATFGTDGQAVTDFALSSDFAYSVAVQSDGRIVVAGSSAMPGGNSFALACYLPDGSLDPAFGDGGKVATAFPSSNGRSEARAYGVAICADGGIIVAGTAYDYDHRSSDIAVARYTDSGVLDVSFGLDGKVMTDFEGKNEFGWCVTIQADGKIIVGGYSDETVEGGAWDYDFALVRYDPDGSLDETFNGTGIVTTHFDRPSYPNTAFEDSVRDVVVQPDGKIVAAGKTYQGGYSAYQFAVARYNRDGSLDLTFGEYADNGLTRTGMVSTSPGGFPGGGAASVAVDASGKIVAAGDDWNVWSDTNTDFAVVRWTANGDVDTSFGNYGVVRTDFNHKYHEHAYGVAIQPDGRILVAGASQGSGTGSDFALARYIGDGVYPPTSPTVTAIHYDESTDGTTVSGTADPGAIIRIYDENGELLCETTADQDGHWECVLAGDYEDAVISVTASGPGGESPPAEPPASPVVGFVGYDEFSDQTTVSGTAEPYSIIRIYDENGELLCETIADEYGNWECVVSGYFAGSDLSVTASDEDGNTSSGARPPMSPVVGSIVYDRDTNTLIISGTAEPGATVKIYDESGDLLCETIADEYGNWECVISGSYVDASFSVTATDEQGNTSSSSDVPPIVLTPQEAIIHLIWVVEALNLQNGIDNSLDVKLDAASQALDDVNNNNDAAAINALAAFVNSVEAQRGNHISEEDADLLRDAAQGIIDLLST